MDILSSLRQALGDKRVVAHKNISPYITMRTNTSAEYYFEAETEKDWEAVMNITSKLNIPMTIVGGGSNYVILSDMITGLTVRNMYREKKLIQVDDNSSEWLISAGYVVARLAKETIEDGWSGFEYHLGLPGTLGGAIYMNSKWTHVVPTSYIGDNLVKATIIDRAGTVKEVNRDYFQFAYDYSILQKTHEIVLHAIFRLTKEDPDVLRKRAQETMEYRHKTQPHGVATSGCFFRNIEEADKKRLGLPTTSAGYLIDKSGLKNMRVGGFVVSDLHANFVINTGDGRPEDLLSLLQMIKQTVKERFGVELKEEVLVMR